MLNRRELIGSAAALAALPGPASASVSRRLRAMPGKAQLAPDGQPSTAIWGYEGGVPGPELRVKQGERLRVTLDNALPQATTIHWHGIRIDNAMDGVAHLTQPPVEPGEHFDYDFVAPDAGTFWYHPHNRTWEQMARGLYGPLIVEEAEPPAIDRDLVLVLDDWRLTDDAAIDEESFGSLHDWSHAGRLGNWPTVNGHAQPEYPVKSNERLRLRLISACNATVLVLRLDGMDARVVAYDGMPVAPEPVAGEFVLAPAQRIDLIADVTGEAPALMLAGRENFRAASFPVEGSSRRSPLTDPLRLPPNPLPKGLDLKNALAVHLAIEGGAMGALSEARMGALGALHHGGEAMDGLIPLRTLAVEHRLVWALNGVAGMPAEPLFEAERGQSVAVTLVNEGRWPHAMHFHGHHFRETVDESPWRDTILIGPRETKTVAFVADNPGDWMLHCHMLEHQAGGMATWFRVA